MKFSEDVASGPTANYLVGTGVPTAVIADRYKAGECIDALADDYGRGRLEIEDAIRSELQVEAA